MALAIPDHAGCCAKDLDLMFDSDIRNLDEQHSMAFLGLASPSQARARNMHNAERVVRLFAVLLNWESTFAHTKVGQRQISGHTCISHIRHSVSPPQHLSWQSPSFWLLHWTEIWEWNFEFFIQTLIHLASFEVCQSRPVVSFESSGGKVDHTFHGDTITIPIPASGLPCLWRLMFLSLLLGFGGRRRLATKNWWSMLVQWRFPVSSFLLFSFSWMLQWCFSASRWCFIMWLCSFVLVLRW